MNKAMIFPIHKKWVDMIFDGTKKFEFRNKISKHLVEGMKIYFYETLGKVHRGKGVREKYPNFIQYFNLVNNPTSTFKYPCSS